MFAIVPTQAAPDVKTDLKENPDKIAAYNNYMRATMTEIRGLTAKNPDVAEKRIAEMEALLKGLKPTTQQAKTLQQRALRSAGFLKQNLELERTPLADFAKRLEANPDDLKALWLRTTLPGMPMTMELSGTTVPSVTNDPPATMQFWPITTPSINVALIPTSELSPIVALCRTT